MSDRRDFLKLFGVASAAVGVTTLKGTEIEEIVNDSPNPYPPLEDTSVQFIRNHFDIQKARLYSAVEIGQGYLECQHFFTYALNGTHCVELGRQATHADTNMYRACILSMPEAFLVRKMGVIFAPSTKSIMRSRIAERSSLALILGNKIYQRAPLAEMFSVGELDAEDANGELPIKGCLDLSPLPVVINGDYQFRCELESDDVKIIGKVKMWAVLEGLHARAIQ